GPALGREIGLLQYVAAGRVGTPLQGAAALAVGHEVAALMQFALAIILPRQLGITLVGSLRQCHRLAVGPEVRRLDAVAAVVVAGRRAVVAVLVQAGLAVQPEVRPLDLVAALVVAARPAMVASLEEGGFAVQAKGGALDLVAVLVVAIGPAMDAFLAQDWP